MADILVDSTRVMADILVDSARVMTDILVDSARVMADIMVDSARVMSYGRHPGRFCPSYELWQTSWSILPEL